MVNGKGVIWKTCDSSYEKCDLDKSATHLIISVGRLINISVRSTNRSERL